MPRTFISYRRSDSAGYAGWLNDRLSRHFGQALIFRDLSTIPPGVDFVVTIVQAVGSPARP